MTIGVPAGYPDIELYRATYVQVAVRHLINTQTGELFDRYEFADPATTCLHWMRPWTLKDATGRIYHEHRGFCLLDKNHRGRHSTTVFNCDLCGKTRRGTPTYADDTVSVCFVCYLPTKNGWAY